MMMMMILVVVVVVVVFTMAVSVIWDRTMGVLTVKVIAPPFITTIASVLLEALENFRVVSVPPLVSPIPPLTRAAAAAAAVHRATANPERHLPWIKQNLYPKEKKQKNLSTRVGASLNCRDRGDLTIGSCGELGIRGRKEG
jgi:hypothetical protein